MTDRNDDTDVGGPQRSGHGRTRDELMRLNVDQLMELAAQEHIKGRSRMGKEELIDVLTGRRD